MARQPSNGPELSFPTGSFPSFNPGDFDDSLKAHGVKLVHWRSMLCPVGLVDKYDSRRPHDDHSGCSNGMLYTKAGEVTVVMTGVSHNLVQNDIGMLDGSTVQCTAPRTYDESEQKMRVLPFDRFYLLEESIAVPHQQLVEAHATGRDKLSFPVEEVLDVVDASGKRYSDDDYRVEGGQIVWVGDRPGYNLEAKRGVIYSVRYLYKPYWYVQRLMHEVRFASVDTPLERMVVQMPQQFLLQREYVSESEERDDQAPDPDSIRQMKAPRRGAYSPR